jgi:hypothetical protein
MDPLHLSMLMHLLGFGIVCSALVGSWLLNTTYRNAGDFRTKATILKTLHPLDLLSAVAIVMLLITGIGNMRLLSYGWFTTAWLSMKIALFLGAAVTGAVLGVRGAQRMRLVVQIAEGSASGGAEGTLRQMDGHYQLLTMIQSFLILAILALSVYKPGQYGS